MLTRTTLGSFSAYFATACRSTLSAAAVPAWQMYTPVLDSLTIALYLVL
jgi:hypothetical protein